MILDIKSIPQNAKKRILHFWIYFNRLNPLYLLNFFKKNDIKYSTRNIKLNDNFSKGGYEI
jgi:hypothetical protein